MTSISVISSVISRIGLLLDSLDEPKDPPSWKSKAAYFKSNLGIVNAVLKNVDQVRKQSNQFVEYEKQMVELSYDIDDYIAAIDQSLIPKPTKRSIPSGRSLLARMLTDKSSKEIGETLQNKFRCIQEKYKEKPQVSQKSDENFKKTSTSPERGKSLLNDPGRTEGEADEISLEEKIRETLLSNQKPLVLCVWGESGMGKTTVAKKAYHNKDVREHFEGFAWVSIHQDFQTKQVLQEILLQLLPDRKGYIRGMDEFELMQQIFSVHKEKSCLIVLEDICTVEDWQSICVAFPTTGQSSSKILITTPLKIVAEEATSKDGVFQMTPLTRQECFDLLKKKEIGSEELEKYGDTIFTLSGGSRLHALVLGKSLKTENVNANKKLLDDLAKIRGDKQERERKILQLGYEGLSHELKSCLVYMGQFPHGRDIEDEKLYLLLSTEGLIIPPEASTSTSVRLKTIFLDILEKLAQKTLVQLQEFKVPEERMYRSCKLHDQIQNFCISEGLAKEFFEIVDFTEAGKELKATTRRFAIYLNKYRDENHIQFSNDCDMEKKIRSLLIFDTYESEQKSTTWPSEINDLKEFIRLRVLDFNGIDFGVRKLPKGIDKLVLLKYLSFRGCCFSDDLPAYISKLLCLETLDLRTNSEITIPDVLHSLKRLKHLYFPAKYKSHDAKNKLQLNGLEKLEILVNFDTSVCKVEDLSGLKNLQTLTVTSHEDHKDMEVVIKCLDGNKDNLNESSITVRNFDCYTTERATMFHSLLRCYSLHSLNMEGHIGQLPEAVDGIYQSLTEMILNGSNLKDDSMEVLGKIKNLQILVLSNDAYVGKKMKISAAWGFSNLTIFKLVNLSYLEEVTLEENAMPKLSDFVIEWPGESADS